MRKSINHLAIAAAVTGLFAGSMLSQIQANEPGQYAHTKEYGGDKNACKGLNARKGKGGCKTDANACKGMNACKGKGGCATSKNDCKGMNDCKGLGGCKAGANGCKGKNDCKGKGGCKVGH